MNRFDLWEKLCDEVIPVEIEPAKGKVYIGNYRAKIYHRAKGVMNSAYHTEDEWEWVKRCFDYKCALCGLREPDVRLTRDHKIPLSLGGLDSIDNIQPLCAPCNSLKNDKIWFSACFIGSSPMS